jgi:hypothetical protein
MRQATHLGALRVGRDLEEKCAIAIAECGPSFIAILSWRTGECRQLIVV